MKLNIVDRVPVVVFDDGNQKLVEKLSLSECEKVRLECLRRVGDISNTAQSILQRNQIPLNTQNPIQFLTNEDDKNLMNELTTNYNNCLQWIKLIVYQMKEAGTVAYGIKKSLWEQINKGKESDN